MELRRSALLALLLSAPALACDTDDQQRLLARIDVQVRAGLALDGAQLELTPIGALPTLAAPRVRLLGPSLRSRLAVELEGVPCTGGPSQTQTLWFKARAWREAWVYGRDGHAERALADAQPRRARIDVAALQLQPLDLAQQIDGLWLNQATRAGAPVLKRHLQPEPLVQRNAVVNVVVQGPGLRLQTQGKVMRQGQFGERVPVLVDGAESSMMAVVSAKGEVHVEH